MYAHQEPKSFNGSLKRVAMEELSKQGCTVTVSDLYAMDFEPRATRKDITGESEAPGLRWCATCSLVWFNYRKSFWKSEAWHVRVGVSG